MMIKHLHILELAFFAGVAVAAVAPAVGAQHVYGLMAPSASHAAVRPASADSLTKRPNGVIAPHPAGLAGKTVNRHAMTVNAVVNRSHK